MAYATGTAANMNALMTALSTFATANGWTEDQYTAESGTATHGRLSLHNTSATSVYVTFYWNTTNYPHVAVYQALGYTPASHPAFEPDNAGNGTPQHPGIISAFETWNQPTNYRYITDVGAGEYTSYAFFSGSSDGSYIHCALEYAPFTYRHFGFGDLEKAWDWTGGGYCYGHSQSSGSPLAQSCLISSYGTTSGSTGRVGATLNCEGLNNQPAGSKWGSTGQFATLGILSSRDDEDHVRIVGGAPGGPLGSVFNNISSNSGDGFLPMSANAIFYRDVSQVKDDLYFMGWQPDIRTLNVKNFSPKDEITIGSDTWVIYPHAKKQNTGDPNESDNLGIAYKKVT